ncbi:CdaR family protein [Evansella cellulosilytica]|uniref:YbbR family protein n=1 Tax=Evansella cellulosilytica (strain ATCC 21833 / DSM 2522 / FERM P-1141 / JCM 9156 / N-4) TaxID=649639 RepID=E6TTC0_EVAC2|nr:CdaR family protein [Evansella cellulosilytica]ADU28460.1 YbbR family protein [Evansella cellulosilytica DSM 2522]
MDKWFNNSWVLKGVSLLIAMMLFLVVNMDRQPTQTGGLPGITNGQRVIEELDLTVYYDEDTHVVTEAPEHVQVTLRGPQNILTLLALERQSYEVFVDVRGKEPGVHYERVQHRDFHKDLNVSINPPTVRITIQEKQTVSLPVEVDIINEGEVGEGYSIGTPTVSPSNVDITAAQGVIEQIASVRAVVDVAGRDATFQSATSVIVLDQNGNEMNVNTDPPAVEVTVPITAPNKEVPVRIEREGELPEGIAVESITAEPSTITVFGPVSIINDISFIDGVKVDLSNITESTSFEVDVQAPNGVERIAPETITITIEVTQEEEREFSNFEIDVVGVPEGNNYAFIEPEEGMLDISILGSRNVLDRVSRTDIQLYVDLNDLSDGEHDVPLQFNGPQGVRIDPNIMNSVRLVIYDEDEEPFVEEPVQGENTSEEIEGEQEENTT